MAHTRPWDAERAAALIKENAELPAILQALQERFGHLDKAAIPLIAFKAIEPTRGGTHHTLRICRAEWCKAADSDGLIEHVDSKLGVQLGVITQDGSFTVDAIYC